MNIVIKSDGQNRMDVLKTFIKTSLEKNLLYAVVIPIELNGKVTVVLVRDTALLDNAVLLPPALPVNSSRVVSDITKVSPPSNEKKIGVFLRSCEQRALIELVKLKQASLDNIVVIGVDCLGTYPFKDYNEGMRPGDSLKLREACTICEYPETENADIVLGLGGTNDGDGLLLCSKTKQGDELLSELGADAASDELLKKREDALAALKTERLAEKDRVFAQYSDRFTGLEKLREILASCIYCQNCRKACPACYCRECIFDSPIFEWNAGNYIAHADKLGALAMPSDRLLFHLTRLNHMSASCTGCGLCEEACPVGISVFSMFRLSGDRVQAAFDYVAGRDVNEPLPVKEFREKELENIGS